VAALLRRSVDYRRSRAKIWYLAAVLLMPVVTALAYGIMRLARQPLAIPQFSVVGTPVLLLVFFIAALGEELGWSGYAIDPLQARYGPLLAAVILGIIWAAWHIVAMVQAGQSPGWIAWGCLDMVATRVLMVWLYDNAGKSVFVVTLYHAVANVSTKSMFPGGSYPGERIISVVLAILAATVALSWPSRRVYEPG
jgi:membrane protease YdiL (CAAX protease family)